jgi:hypothetical protein
MAVGKQDGLSAEQCTAKAVECRELAKTANRQEHRIMLEHMADTWERVAADISQRFNQ